jgi:uncharacterized protein YgiM (DUF1202 family)
MNRFLILILFVFTVAAFGDDSKLGIITGNKVNLRDNPGKQSNVLFQLNKNDKVELLSPKKAEWNRIKYKNITGYVYYEYLAFTKEEKEYFTAYEKYNSKYEFSYVIDSDSENHFIQIKDSSNHSVLFKNKIPSYHQDDILKIFSYYPYVVVSAYSKLEVGSSFCHVYNFEKKEFLGDMSDSGMYFMSMSPSRKFLAMDSGTSPGFRGLTIIELKTKKIVLQTSYYVKISWDKNDSVTFVSSTSKSEKMGSPANKEEGNAFGEVVTWTNGKRIDTGTFQPVFVQD